MKFINYLISLVMPLMPRWLIRRFADRYIAGETMKEALDLVKRVNEKRMCATLDLLGESTASIRDANDAAYQYMNLLDEIAKRGLDANISIKLTQMGLLVDKNNMYSLMEKIAVKAQEHNNFVRIDMEHSAVTSETIEAYKYLQEKYGNFGIVLQAYLKRTAADLSGINKMNGNIRLCKGIYKEPKEIAYRDREVVRENYMKLLEMQLLNGNYVGIATHDEVLVDRAETLLRRLKISTKKYEFQMLLGVSTKLQNRIRAQGHKLRLYMPFGAQWYEYSMRRFRENPKMVSHIFRNLFRRYKKL